MLEKINFNTLINHVIFTIDLLTEDKDYPQELVEYLYLITTGMIITYGDKYIDDIYNTIAGIKFKDKDSKNRIYLDNHYEDLSYINPTMHNYLNKFYDLSCNFPSIKIDYGIIYKKLDSSYIKTLEFLTHEINAILFNKNKKYTFKSNIRLRFDYLKNGLIEDNEDKNTFSRVFNVLQSEEIIKNILLLRNERIENKKFTNILLKFEDIDFNTYKFEGLDILVNLFRPLYELEDIKLLINNNLFLNNDYLEKEFDKVLGKNSYNNVCRKLDNLDKIICDSMNDNYNNYFALSLEYISIKNDFVNKYINEKCLNEIS